MDMSSLQQRHTGHRMIQLGVLLFLLGLLGGFAIPLLKNPRMGLTSHLEGVMNGMVLILLGLVWPRLALGAGTLRATFWLAVYATFANWAATLLAAVWGAGRSMPIAAPEPTATVLQETVVDTMLLSLSVSLVGVCVVVLWGLRGWTDRPPADAAESAHTGVRARASTHADDGFRRPTQGQAG